MEKTFEIELSEVRPKVVALARNFCRASALAADPEDIAQDVLLRLWTSLKGGSPIRNVEAWAVRATKNACISAWRKKNTTAFSRLAHLPEGNQLGSSYDVVSDSSVLDRIRESEASAILQRTLEGFSDGTRKLLKLRASGLSLDEISAITGRSKGSVKSSISTARKTLIQSLG